MVEVRARSHRGHVGGGVEGLAGGRQLALQGIRGEPLLREAPGGQGKSESYNLY